MKYSLNNPSPAYLQALEDCRRHHATTHKTYTGKFLRTHIHYLKWLIENYNLKSALDYGCGKGHQYDWVIPKKGIGIKEWWGIPVQLYEPAIPKLSYEPEGKYDLVICTHTLGTIPITDMEWVIDRLHDLTSGGGVLYIAEKIGKSRKRNKIYTADKGTHHDGWLPAKWMEVIKRKGCDITVIFAFKGREGGLKQHHIYDSEADEWIPYRWPQIVYDMWEEVK